MTLTVQGLLDPLTQTAFDNSQAGVNNTTNPVLIIGQATNAQPFQLYPCTSVAQARNFAGAGSQLSRAFEAYFANDQVGPIYLLPYADAAGSTPAIGFFLITGTPTANGTLAMYIGGQSVPVGVSSGMTPVAIASAAAAIINAIPNLNVTATTVAAADMTLRKLQVTSKNAGTLGNLIDLRMNYQGAANGEVIPPGMSVTVTAMSGGATDPDLTQIAPVVGDTRMRLFVHGYGSSASIAIFAAMMNFSAGRWSPLRASMGHCFTAVSMLPAALETYGPTNNDPHTSVFAFETGSPTPEWEAAGIWAGSMASSLRAQPNQPVQTLPLNGFSPPPAGLAEANGGAFMRTTRNTLMGLGLGCARYDSGSPAISRAPTTYQVNGYGQPDQSYFDTEDMFLLMAIQDRIVAAETQQYPRSLVADDGTKFNPQLPITTPQLFKGFMVDLYMQMQFDGLVEDAQPFIAASSAVRNLSDPSRMDVLWAPYLVVGLRDIANTIQFRKYSAAAAAAASGAAT